MALSIWQHVYQQRKASAITSGATDSSKATTILDRAPIHILSDSAYSIGVLSKGWRAKMNQQLISGIKEQILNIQTLHRPIYIHWIKAHVGIPGNEFVDQLAFHMTNFSTIVIFNQARKDQQRAQFLVISIGHRREKSWYLCIDYD